MTDARKNPLQGEDAWERIGRYKKIKVAKGKKVLEFSPGPENKETVLSHCLGRTGNLRAPVIDMDGVLYVGYNEEIYGNS